LKGSTLVDPRKSLKKKDQNDIVVI
jgi:hypothetical protein